MNSKTFGNAKNLQNISARLKINLEADLHEFQDLKELQKDKKEQVVIDIEESEIKDSVFIESDSIENGVKKLTIDIYKARVDEFEFLEPSCYSDEVLLLTLIFSSHQPKLEPEDLEKLNIKCTNKSVVIILDSKNCENFFIMWKFKDFQHFWTLQIDKQLKDNEMMKLKEFLANFLVESLKNQHTGLINKFNKNQSKKPVDIDYLADSRDFNLLLLATERGNDQIVKILIELNLITQSLDGSIDARNLAIEHKHQDVLLALLKANLPFPSSFEVSKCTGKLKEFCDTTQEFHQLIEDNNVKKAEEILNQHKGLKLFYNFRNHSAVRVALENHSYDIYELLLSRKFSFAPNEVPKNYLEGLKHGESRKVREIHNIYSDHLIDKHINILMANSHIFQDKTDGQEYRHVIQRAFEALNSNLFIQIILKIVAASMNFKLIFDFNRDTIDIVDPTADEYTEGMFYLFGRIYIGAKQLLNKATEHEALGVIAHELCHFAMNLVYKNDARPYKSSDKKTKEEFEDISQECQQHQEKEDLIKLVYDCYKPDMHHAELIVRVVHLLAVYRNAPDKLKEVSSTFSRLFEFYKSKSVPELQKALPKIEKKHLQKDKKIYNLRRALAIGTILAICFISAAIYLSIKFSWTCQYDKLSGSEKITVQNGTVIYKNEKIQFQKLFPMSSLAYNALKPDHCSELLGGQSIDFSLPDYHYLYEQVSKDNKIVQNSIANASIIYGNETVQFNDLFIDNSLVYNKLNPANTAEILKGKPLNFTDLRYLYEFASIDSQMIRGTLYNADVVYKNVKIQLCDLFPENSKIYSNFSTVIVSDMLKGEVLDLSGSLYYLDQYVRHSWGNLTKNLRDKFLNSNFNFQNHSVKFQDVHNLSPNSFEFLTNEQIIEVLSDKPLNISKMIANETTFYVERDYRDESLLEIYFDYMVFLGKHTKNEYACWYYNITKSPKTFDEFYTEFTSQSIPEQVQKTKEIKHSDDYRYCARDSAYEILDPDTEEITDYLQIHTWLKTSYDQMIEEAKNSKILILSSEAGAGKTVNFEQWSLRLKKKLPSHWVSYIDLKEYKKFYNSSGYFEDVEGLLNGILGLNSRNEFEKRTFWELFNSGNVILLWNGYDEISPKYSNFTLNVLDKIRTISQIMQFICTRPIYSDELKLKFNVKTFTLIPLNEQKQQEFLTKFFVSQKIDDAKIPEYIEKVLKIVNSLNSNEKFDTPLMLAMIAELISKDTEIYESENLFEIYEIFIEKKIEIWQRKSEIARKFLNKAIVKYRKFSMIDVYQKYALEMEFSSKFTKNLKIVHKPIPKEFTNDEISKMSILYINGPDHFKFSHTTFVEFFLAQFFIENIFIEEELVKDEEAIERFELFNRALTYGSENIANFMNEYLGANNVTIQKILKKTFKDKFPRIFFAWLHEKRRIPFLKVLLHFYDNDHETLTELLNVDENETFYTATFNYFYFSLYSDIDRDDIKSLTRQHLTDEQFGKFIQGKNQKGVILFSLHCFWKHLKLNITHDEYALGDELLDSNDSFYVFESIAKNLTKHELYELLMKKTSPLYQFDVRLYSNEIFWKFVDEKMTVDGKSSLIELLGDLLLDREIFNALSIRIVRYQTFNQKSDLFQELWSFVANNTSIDKQKAILRQRDEDSWTFLHNSLFYRNSEKDEIFHNISKIYSETFSKLEIQELFSTPSDMYMELFKNPNGCEYKFKFLEEVFSGNKNLLKKTLDEKIYDTDLSVFEYSDEKGYNNFCYKLFNDLYHS